MLDYSVLDNWVELKKLLSKTYVSTSVVAVKQVTWGLTSVQDLARVTIASASIRPKPTT